MSTFSRLKENVPLIFFQKGKYRRDPDLRRAPARPPKKCLHDNGKTNLLVGPSSSVSSKNTLNNAAKVPSASACKIVPKQRAHLVMELRILASLRSVTYRIGTSRNDGTLSWKARRMPFGLENVGQDRTERRARPDFVLHCVLCFRGTVADLIVNVFLKYPTQVSLSWFCTSGTASSITSGLTTCL